MEAALQPQTSLYEATLENAELEAALERRQAAKEQLRGLRKSYRELDDDVKASTRELGLDDDSPVRIGRFLITRRTVAPRVVHFETEPTTRLVISLLDEQ
jgi:hypothetical protein